MAYLSSELLDECVKSLEKFPNADEFIKFESEKMAEPSTPPFEPLDPKFWEPGSPVSPVSPIVGSPHSDETGFVTAQGGKRKYKKTKKRKTIRKKIRKGRRTHYSRRR